MFSKRYVSAGIEIGTNSIKVLLAELRDDDVLSFIGGSEVPYPDGSTDKVMYGEIENSQVIGELLRQALIKAENSANAEISNYHIAITGSHISNKFHNETRPTEKKTPPTEDDIFNLEDSLQQYSLSESNYIIHNVRRKMFINNTHEVRELVGQICNNYRQENLIIFGNNEIIEKTTKSLSSITGYNPDSVTFSGIAPAYATLNEDERETNNGILLIDIGEGITEFSLIHNGNFIYAGQKPIGCRQVANDLAIAFGVPFSEGKRLLIKNAEAIINYDNFETFVEIHSGNSESTQKINQQHIEKVVHYRLKELFELIREELQSAGVLDRLGDKILLSGGGAQIKQINKLAREVFKNVPVKTACINNVAIDSEFENPRFITPAGVIMRALEEDENWGPRGLWQQIGFDLRDLFKGVGEVFGSIKSALKF